MKMEYDLTAAVILTGSAVLNKDRSFVVLLLGISVTNLGGPFHATGRNWDESAKNLTGLHWRKPLLGLCQLQSHDPQQKLWNVFELSFLQLKHFYKGVCNFKYTLLLRENNISNICIYSMTIEENEIASNLHKNKANATAWGGSSSRFGRSRTMQQRNRLDQ